MNAKLEASPDSRDPETKIGSGADPDPSERSTLLDRVLVIEMVRGDRAGRHRRLRAGRPG